MELLIYYDQDNELLVNFHLNSNMELLIFSTLLTLFTISSKFKFQYGATNIQILQQHYSIFL